jgi:MoaA/NifB/PqqE/SkfB family radical SAM enzyme
LDEEGIRSLISQAAELGAVMYNVWGTEPLLRQDLPQYLAWAKKLGLRVSLITNGVLLKERLREIADYLDYLVVSIDGVGETYRKIRGVDAYREVLQGIEKAVEAGIKTGINCVLCSYNVKEAPLLVQLAQELGVTVTFEPVHPFEEVRGWEEIEVAGRPEYMRAVDKIIELKREGYRIGNSYAYLGLMRRFSYEGNDFRCRVGRFLLLVEPDGRVNVPCSKYGCIGSFREESLHELWNSPFAIANRERSRGCNQCLFSGFVEASLLYDLKPSAVVNFFRII